MKHYKVEKTEEFKKEFQKLDNSVQILVLKFIKKLEESENPKSYGKSLSGELSGKYRFRINNYRLLTIIKEDKMIIYALKIGHRSKVYGIQKIQFD